MKHLDRVIDYIANRVLDRMEERRPHGSHNFHIVNNTSDLAGEGKEAAQRLMAAQDRLAKAQYKAASGE